MAISSYIDIMFILYYQDDIFQKYVDNWTALNGCSKFVAFENEDVQRKARKRIQETEAFA